MYRRSHTLWKLQRSGYCGARINKRPRGKGDYEGSPVPPALLLIHTPHSPGCYDGNLCAAILGVHDWPQLPESHHTDGPKIRRFQGSCNTRVTAAQGSTRDQEEREIEGSPVPPALLLIHTP